MNSMMHTAPMMRPRIEDVVARFSRIRESLSVAKLRSLITSRWDSSIITAFRHTGQAIRTVWYIISKTPAISVPIMDHWGCLDKGLCFIVEVGIYVN